jgi:UDP-N-acetylglucosamine 2-epimerase (non-hydrolysing)
VMIDTLKAHVARAVPASQTLAATGFADGYTLVTLHRPSNVDEPEVLARLVGCLAAMSADTPIVFPIHPRTRARIEAAGLMDRLAGPRFVLLEPQGYLHMLGLMTSARVVVTDSGGLQEETTALGVPCLTVRENTERPITVTDGTNTLVGIDDGAIMAAFQDVLTTGGKAGRAPELWDGQAATRIADIVHRRL